MLSSTADHLFWMARYMERAGKQAHACCGAAGKTARGGGGCGFMGPLGASDVV